MKFELGRVQRILSGALKDWVTIGGDGMLSANDAKREATRHVNQSIDMFTKVTCSVKRLTIHPLHRPIRHDN